MRDDHREGGRKSVTALEGRLLPAQRVLETSNPYRKHTKTKTGAMKDPHKNGAPRARYGTSFRARRSKYPKRKKY